MRESLQNHKSLDKSFMLEDSFMETAFAEVPFS